MGSTEEFLSHLEEIKCRHRAELAQARFDFARSRSIANVGDTVSDQRITIIVTEIKWTVDWFHSLIPSCVYVGTVLTDKSLHRREGKASTILQSKVTSVNGIEVVHD